MKTTRNFWSSLAQFFLKWKMFQTNFVEEMKTHILCSIKSFLKSCRLWDNMEKHYRAGQATDDNVTHAHYMLDTKGCKHTIRKCYTYCFSTATIVEGRRLVVRLYVHCLSCNYMEIVPVVLIVFWKSHTNFHYISYPMSLSVTFVWPP